MKPTPGLRLIVSALLLTLTMALPACVQQQDTGSASLSMHQAGESAKDAVSSTGQVFVHAYQGAATAVDDSTITARVKTALFNDKITTGADIHITTVAGVVTLDGQVPSSDVAERAAQVVQQTVGVKGAKNALTVVSPGSATN